MKVSEIGMGDSSSFDELAHSTGSIFNTVKWTGLFGGKIRRYGLRTKGGEMVGGFITYKERKFGLGIYRNPPFTPMVGPFINIEASNPSSIADVRKRALSAMADFFDGLPGALVMCSLNRSIIDMQPFIWKKFKVTPGYTYLLDLSITSDDLWNGLSSERRKGIRKAGKDGLMVERTSDMNVVRTLVCKTFDRQNMKLDRACLDSILFDFAKDHNSFAFVTYDEGNPVASAFCIHDAATAYYLLGGYDGERKHHGAGTLAMWEAITYAQELGLRFFDFEGSMIPQVEIYFRGFGGSLTPYYRISKAVLPLEILLKFFKREIF